MSSTVFVPLPATGLLPPVHRGLKVLDRNLFSLDVPVLAARIPAALTTKFAREDAKKYLLKIPRVIVIVADPDSKDHRLVLLNGKDEAQLPTELLEVLRRDDVPLIAHSVSLPYEYWSADEILQATLPEELLDESPTSFTQVGHIAHLNLKDEYLPHRHLIGQVILDKNKSLRTVVNKLNTIDNEFRNFAMEVLAGDNDFLVSTSESGCTFKFDFSLVYWNSRLQGEHGRLVESFSPHDVVVDAFAGVGPFAVPAGKKGCGVMASDLNPASASALEENVKINRVEANVRTANEDARAFIRQSVLDIWTTPFAPYTPLLSSKARAKLSREAARLATSDAPSSPLTAAPPAEELPPRRLVDHFVMNLPATAIEFLDAFRGLYRPLYELERSREAIEASRLPMVHCYCFTKDVEHAEEDICARATKALGTLVNCETEDFKLRFVRDVAPKKEMYCLEFRLSKEMVA